ncbi:hypothetical protein [Helicobacter trogontum]|uniref:Barstar (barnase inhibitor) domain-containing protein n=1 Tax=Helicobacter trogontum TaxID=50960 RepID=A0A4U8S9Q8_9HELI|nr:hypothetical protein [Helicobacter trogontum]TLD82763.1 hypothetical protein LS81_007110 [Helicobacter trogontum]
MNYAKKDNKVYFVKSMDEVTLKDDKDLFIVKLDGSKLHTYDEFEKTAKAAFQTPTDESMNWLNEPGNPFCWIDELDWLLDAGFNSFALIVENWSKTLDRDSQKKKESLLWDFNYICDYWGYELLEVRGGSIEPKDFNIYLVG